MGSAGFVCGLLGLLIGLFGVVAIGVVLSILGIVFSSVALPSDQSGKAKAGLTMAIIGLIACMVAMVLYAKWGVGETL
ncbi:hypothetical protein SAMN05660209_03601 [Geodermatophilus africanus]|uniref:DUF4190 domain-containing protein n=2 Tax=Geodermatophilus africanus TaxID=1137993 RepID=A0A1H3M937_9ACTN|nr:hypothetical protein SAMN05660209_03601 [Geodermatophilus africanus]